MMRRIPTFFSSHHFRTFCTQRRNTDFVLSRSRTSMIDRQRQLGTTTTLRNKRRPETNKRIPRSLQEAEEYKAFCRQQIKKDQPPSSSSSSLKANHSNNHDATEEWAPWEPFVYFGVLPILIWCGIVYCSPELRQEFNELMGWHVEASKDDASTQNMSSNEK
jgi:hypothetical protein